MNLFEFMSGSPVLTFFLGVLIMNTVVGIAKVISATYGAPVEEVEYEHDEEKR